MRKKTFINLLFVLIVLIVSASSAFATPFVFYDIPDTDTPPINIASNFLGDVSDYGSGQVLFTINNAGPVTSFIRQVYWEYDGTLLTNGAFSSSNSIGITALGGVNFILDSPTNNPPQSSVISFSADLEYIADNPGSGKQGVDVGETVAFLFSGNFSDILEALNDGSLRIALHAQGIVLPGITSDGSDSYVSTPVPEPISMLLFGTGLVGIGGFVRKKFKK